MVPSVVRVPTENRESAFDQKTYFVVNETSKLSLTLQGTWYVKGSAPRPIPARQDRQPHVRVFVRGESALKERKRVDRTRPRPSEASYSAPLEDGGRYI